jgi:hypothetical protein
MEHFDTACLYWSSIHINTDFYYTTLSCLSENTDDNSILFYFVFPFYRVAVPMRSGDVVFSILLFTIAALIHEIWNQNFQLLGLCKNMQHPQSLHTRKWKNIIKWMRS